MLNMKYCSMAFWKYSYVLVEINYVYRLMGLLESMDQPRVALTLCSQTEELSFNEEEMKMIFVPSIQKD